MQEFSANNRQTIFLDGWTPAVTDLDGQPFKNTDGTPVTVEQLLAGVTFSSDDDTIADVPELVDGNLKIGSDQVGHTVVNAAIPYPDGSVKNVHYGVTVGNSAPGEPTFTARVEDEPAPPTP